MNIVQVFVALVVIVIGYHFFRLTLEAHTLITPATSDSVAAIYPDHRDLTFIIGTLPNTIFKHIFFEEFITPSFSFLAGQSRMISILG